MGGYNASPMVIAFARKESERRLEEFPPKYQKK